MQEIERKYLVRSPPPALERFPGETIEQGYLAITSEGTEVRLRRRDDRTLLTVKRGGGRIRAEEEVELDADDFARLWPLTEPHRLEKVRHEITYDELVIELDVYRGRHEGLVIAEVEFDSEEACDAFIAPGWLGEEVTADPRYANQALARDGLPARA
jgi:adenylate cyclase